MDNVLRKTIRDEIESVLNNRRESQEGTSSQVVNPANTVANSTIDERKMVPKKKKTEQRLGNLLSRIRENYKKKSDSKPMKKLQVKYQRYCQEENTFKTVKAKEGGGVRFIEVEHLQPVTFSEIMWKAVDLFFYENFCNFYLEDRTNCMFELVSLSAEKLNNENLWDYLNRKGLCLSRTVFVLQSTLSDTSDDFLPPFPSLLNNEEVDLSSCSSSNGRKRKICQTCFHSYEGEECIICEQNSYFVESLLADSSVSNDVINDVVDISPPVPSELDVNPVELSPPRPSPAELRQIRINNFSMNNEFALKKVTIHRLKIKEDLIKEFQRNDISMSDKLSFEIIDAYGAQEMGVGSGVNRDVYSLFWKEVADSYLIGSDQRVPMVRHDLYVSEWKAIGKILVKGFLDTGYFPTILSKCFIKYCLFGETDDNELIDGFLKYLAADEQVLIKQAMDATDPSDIISSEEFLDILDEYKCRSLVTSKNLNEILIELAKQELYQKPHIMSTCWAPVFTTLKEKIHSSKIIDQIYDSLNPTNKKVLSLLDSSPATDAERECFHYFKKYVKGLNDSELRHLLRFLTGSELIIVERISVIFNKEQSNAARRPIAHTCGPSVEIPCTYNNFCELREEFSNILKANTWELAIL